MKKYLTHFLYLSLSAFIFMALFGIARYVFVKLNMESGISSELYDEALKLGRNYDLMVVSYLLILPSLTLIIAMYVGKVSFWCRRVITIYFSVALFVVLLSVCADIPFYAYCKSRLNIAILMWIDTPATMIKFVFENSAYYPFLIALFGLLFLGIIFFLFLEKKLLLASSEKNKSAYLPKTIITLSVIFLLLVGIRGGWRQRPIGIKDAFVSTYPIINQLPLNPLHSYFDSMEKINLDYLEEKVAIASARRFLHINSPYNFERKPFASPIRRAITFSDSCIKPNIVLVMMESMTAEMTGLSSRGKSFTPTLDSLSKISISFSDYYTCGIHTCNGIYGTLYSMPSIPGEHPLSNIYAVNTKFTGLPHALKEQGYSTTAFCTHDEEFDNMGFFFRNNSYDTFHSYKDYPSGSEEMSFGVKDEVLYDFAYKKLNDLSKSGKPFFTTLLTISTHEPHALPTKTSFKPIRGTNPFEQVYEYADWALGNFLNRCSKETWFNNTVFVFVADHGWKMESPYEMPLSYHHSPFIIHAPWLLKEPKQIDDLATQLDVFPTLMGLLKLPYTNNTMGIDLFKEKRPYVYFCKDYLAGCLDKKHFLIVQKFGDQAMYEYKSGKQENVVNENIAKADSMKAYMYSMFQTSQWMLENQLCGAK